MRGKGAAGLAAALVLGACGGAPAPRDPHTACLDQCARHESEWFLACQMRCDRDARAPAFGLVPTPPNPGAPQLGVAPGAGVAALGAKATPIDVAAGSDVSCALLSDATVRCWGSNELDQIGTKEREHHKPVSIAGLRDVAQIAVGAAHACALHKDGGVSCWGSNYSGELGVGTTTASPTPVRVPGLANVKQIAAGSSTCALLSDGTVTCWGDWDAGYGDPRSIGSQSPVAIVGVARAVEIAVGGSIACARLQTGAISCWRHISPGLVPRGKVRADPYAVRITDAASLALVDTGAAVTTSGTVKCWGWGSCAFDLGRDGPGPLDWAATFVVPKLTGVAEVALGSDLACARLVSGAIVCEEQGKKGRRDVGAIGAKKIVTGAAHACALVPTGAVCWGRNDRGQLGDGTTTSRDDPRPVAL